MRLAVIPARGGSKRIPRKNIKLFGGLPMIAWSIRAAIESKCFDRIIVSTDDEEISQIAKIHGADVPFIRPIELSGDHIGTMPVIAHSINSLHVHDQVISEVCCIYATAPFVRAADLQRGQAVLTSTGADYAFSVTSYPSPIQRALRVTTNNRLDMLYPKYFHTRSQDLEVAWHDAGQFYWGKSEAWLESRAIFDGDAAPVFLPRYLVQDIDTEEDWKNAELMFSAFFK